MSGRALGEAIRRVGTTAYLVRKGEALPFPASLQPVHSHAEGENSPAGYGLARTAVLYAPCGGPADKLAPGDRIRYGGRFYRVISMETQKYRGLAVYYQAALRPETGEE